MIRKRPLPGLAITLSLLCQASFAHDRSEADAARDATSKPLQVLGFLGVQPGWTALDLFAGNGYYSEVLSGVVGDVGKVYLHNNRAYLGFVKRLDERLRDNRLPNVERYYREVEDINLKSESVDLVMLVMTYHDAYYVDNGWTVTPDPLFSTIHRVLKPGGVLAVIDHHAVSGTGNAAAQSLHRIDVEFAKRDIGARGFTFAAQSNLLAHDRDDLTKNVFDPIVRGKTSKFLLKFVRN
jgi:predicted methyltransferase